MRKISEKVIIDNGYKQVWESIFENDTHERKNILTLGNSRSTTDNVVIFIVTTDGMCILNREFRFGPQKYIIGVPTGNIDIGETPEQAAIRETQEETGYIVRSIIPLGIFIDNTYTTAMNYYMMAVCETLPEKTALDAFESLTNMVVSLDVCERMILEGEIECCFTPTIYFLAKEKTNNFTNL